MVNVQTLSDTFTPFDVKYAGLIPEIPSDIDPSGRTDLLKVLDQGKKDGQILTPETGGLTMDAVLGINAYSIRITDKQSEEILLCAPVHMIASVGFVKEEGLNILPIKIGEIDGSKGVYDLAVIYCKTSDIAEMICNILGQCFQLVYQEATMQCFDESRGDRPPAVDIFSHKSLTVSSASRTNDGPEGPSFISGSRSDLSRLPAARRTNAHLHSSTTPSESDRVSSGHPNELIQEYLSMLSSTLTHEELRQFAVLIKRWRGENLPFPEFIQKVLELYGSERKHLLARMRPFVHGPEDIRFFNRFLDKAGISENAESSLASNSPASDSLYSRSMAESSSEWNSLRLLMTTPFGTTTSSAPQIPEDDDLSSIPAILRPPPRRRHRPHLGNVIVEMDPLAHDNVSPSQQSPSDIAEDKL